MKATVTVDVDIKNARTALSIAGYDVKDKTDEEICEMAIKMNDCYAVKTEKINNAIQLTWILTKSDHIFVLGSKNPLDVFYERSDKEWQIVRCTGK